MSRPGLVKVDPTTAWNKPQSLFNNLKVLSQEIVQILSYILETLQILTFLLNTSLKNEPFSPYSLESYHGCVFSIEGGGGHWEVDFTFYQKYKLKQSLNEKEN